MKFDTQHFDVFLRCCDAIYSSPGLASKAENAWLGRSAEAWRATVAKGRTLPPVIANARLSTEALNRGALRAVIAQARHSNSEATVAALAVEILAWGAMFPRNGWRALDTLSNWLPVCQRLLCDPGLPPEKAYELFFTLKDLQGMGPAYYTKLIHFLGDGSGLVMDQWTARSINLLSGKPDVIRLHQKRYVAAKNSADVYARYLEIVRHIRTALNADLGHDITLPETEALLFSLSSRKKVPGLTDSEHETLRRWRSYVSTAKSDQCTDMP